MRYVLLTARCHMLENIAFILILLWLAGVLTLHTFGGVIHVLLFVSIVLLMVRIITGTKPS